MEGLDNFIYFATYGENVRGKGKERQKNTHKYIYIYKIKKLIQKNNTEKP